MPSVGADHDDSAATADKSIFTDSAFRSQLRELPPSAKLVAKVLDLSGPLDQGQLAEETVLPDRTIRYALNQLDDADLVMSHIKLQDARKQVYELQRPTGETKA